jgi:hypothetical protein
MTTTPVQPPKAGTRPPSAARPANESAPRRAHPIRRRKALSVFAIAGFAVAGALVVVEAGGDDSPPAPVVSPAAGPWYGTADATERWSQEPAPLYGSADGMERRLERPAVRHGSADAAERALEG